MEQPTIDRYYTGAVQLSFGWNTNHADFSTVRDEGYFDFMFRFLLTTFDFV
jgi:hypothetical protein